MQGLLLRHEIGIKDTFLGLVYINIGTKSMTAIWMNRFASLITFKMALISSSRPSGDRGGGELEKYLQEKNSTSRFCAKTVQMRAKNNSFILINIFMPLYAKFQAVRQSHPCRSRLIVSTHVRDFSVPLLNLTSKGVDELILVLSRSGQCFGSDPLTIPPICQ